MNLEEIGKFVRRLRKKNNIRQEDLASGIGVSVRTIARVENGENSSLQVVLDCADYFGYELIFDKDGISPHVLEFAERICEEVASNFKFKKDNQFKCGWVYILKPVGKQKPIKIGFTQHDPRQRLESINVATPKIYEVYYSILDSNCRETEKNLHEFFEEYKLENEWFDLDCDVAKQKLIELAKYSIESSEGHIKRL